MTAQRARQTSGDVNAHPSGDTGALPHDKAPPAEELVEELDPAEGGLRRQNEELTDARQAAEAERHRYAALFQHAPDPYVVTDAGGTVHRANAAMAELLGMPENKIYGKPLVVFVAFEDRAAFRDLVTEATKNGRVTDRTICIAPRYGNQRYMSITVVAQSIEGGVELRWILRDITRRLEAEEALRQLASQLDARVAERTAQLEQALAAKDEFLGMISHELKTPITTIAGNAEVLRRHDTISAGARDQALRDIEAEARRLQGLIDDLLALSRAQVGGHAAVEPLLIDRLVTSVAWRCERTFGRQVRVSLAPELPVAMADAGYIEQVLRNLIGNAAKYSPPPAAIDVSVEHSGNVLTFRIADRGPGVPSGEEDKIFEPFYRSQTVATRGVPGAGIGLAVCKRLVTALGGEIWVTSREGGGTEFSFTLPASLAGA